MSTGLPKRIENIARAVDEQIGRSVGYTRLMQSANQGVSSGVITKINGADVTVRLDNGQIITAQLTGNAYGNENGKVTVLGNMII